MYARKRPRVRRSSRFVGLAMIVLGMTLALTAPFGTSLAQAAPARRATRVPALTAYVVASDSTVTPINLATNTPRTPISGIALPEAIAITPNGATAYVTDPYHNNVTPSESTSDTLGAQLTGITLLGAIAITPNGATAYVTRGNAGVTPINLATKTAGATISVAYAGDIAITPNGATAYVTDPYDNIVTPINLATNTPGATITGISFPGAIAITPNGSTAYVTSGGAGVVTPINLATNTAGTPILVAGLPPAADEPLGIAITPNGATAYLTSGQVPNFIDGPGAVTPINTATNTAGTPIPVGTNPGSIAITPNGLTAYVASFGCVPPPPGVPPRVNPCLGPADDNIVTPINLVTNTPGATITVGLVPTGIAITPDQAPVAHLSVTPAEPGQPTDFDASASTVTLGTITTYAWNFGDDSAATTSTPTTAHTYTTPGPYTATVTETDSAGTSTTQVFTGQTMSNNGGPSAVASQSFAVVPPLAIATSSLPGGSVWSRTNRVKYSATLAASGGSPPYKWLLASGSTPLPPGLKLKKSTGVISGKATTAGTYSFTAQVVDTKVGKPKTQNTATATLSITIS